MIRFAAIICLAWSSLTQAGGFMFAEQLDRVNLITHPIGYDGSDNQHLTIRVCIHPDVSEADRDRMEIPIRNAISAWNRLEPKQNNTEQNNPQLASNEIDFESVFMHELGHCTGLAHPNLASESGLSEPDARFAKSFKGTNNSYDLNKGSDDVIASRDDLRGDDGNLSWFRKADNDPFAFGSVFDETTYSVNAGDPDTAGDTGDLPDGHEYVEAAGLQVARDRGLPDGEAVMYQGTRPQETQRALNPDDAAMVRLAMSGIDREQGTSKDYTYEIEFDQQQGDHSDGCHITVNMTGSSFGVCMASASIDSPVPDHAVLTVNTDDPEDPRPRIEFDPDVNWFFNDQLDSDLLFADRFEDQN